MTTALMTLDSSIFRAYDIRGIVGKTLTEENVTLIGKSIGSVVRELKQTQICIARDGRLSGPMLTESLCAGLLASGCDVIDIGMVPTPLLYYATNIFEEHSGVMLTGSHNPPEYNGLKIVVNGKTLAETAITDLHHRIKEDRFTAGTGMRAQVNIVERYINHLVHDIRLARPLKIVIDAGNGVTGMIAPELFKALGCEVHELFCEVDGHFPNHHPDPSYPENLQMLIEQVKQQGADVGLAFDGDGDRLGVVTNQGEIIYPDRLLMLFAQEILATHPEAKIIYDVKCTQHLDALIREHHGEPIMWKTGHSLIKNKLQETQALLAGEMSGHFFFRDRWYGFDDALYAAARLLEILAKHPIDSHTLFAKLPNSVNTPEMKILVEEDEKFALMQKLIDQAEFKNAKEIFKLDGLRISFAEGWGLLRASNTTPYLIVRFEAINQTILENIQTLFRQWLLGVKPDLVLPF